MSYVLLVFIPVVVSATFFSNHYLKLMEKTVIEDSQQTSNQILVNMDFIMSEAKSAVNYLKYNDNLLSILKTYSDSVRGAYPDIFDQLRLDEYMIDIFKSNSNVEGIYIATNNNTIFHQQKLGALKSDYAFYLDQWKEQLRLSKEDQIILPTHEQEILIQRSNTVPHVISLISVIRDYDHRTWGVICIDLNVKAFEKSLDMVRYTSGSQTMLTNYSGEMIYPIPQKVDQQAHEMLKEVNANEANMKDGITSFKLDKQKYIAVSSESSNKNWKVLNVFPYKEVASNVIKIRNDVYMLFGGFLLLFVVGAFVFSRYITSPVKRLILSFREVDKGNLDVKIDTNATDEIGLMCNSFNKMVHNLKITIRDNYEMEIREKEAALSALQGQMNPHFLYNSLEMISMTAVLNNDYQCSEMLNKLGNTLRYTIYNNEKWVALDKEMSYLEDYLGLFRERFPHIQSEIAIPKELLHLQIMKMSIQPFVENILVHARNKDFLHIQISAAIDDQNTLTVIVSDNGGGIPPDRLALIKKQIKHNPKRMFQNVNENLAGSSTGIGIVNTSKRMALEFGEAYGVEVNNVNDGVVVKIRYPVTDPIAL
ncbi:cache domain-containing sensor histidine kinase [Cohnella abietis]|uniref:HAMP domain-containing protein n=1 Tax=Cohnella abietis TaxID=2507935 RepID=A0A3T1DEL0_9BACL|nr:sensor histidine kinase [Cohnella abietis]BBI36345.1 hypothetical protein KCTCHS21_57440 [Cohnella abietis]